MTLVCRNCGFEGSAKFFRKEKAMKSGYSNWCKKCYNKYMRERQKTKEYKRWAHSYRKTKRRKYSQYKWGAISRSLEFNLSFREFSQFWQKPCFYCRSPINTIGIDRVNNDFGYSKDNVVSCCSECNRMKGTLDMEAFVERCRKIAKEAG